MLPNVTVSYMSCFYILAVVNRAAMNIRCMYLFELEILSFLVTYPAVELLDHIVVQLLVFKEAPYYFSSVQSLSHIRLFETP